MLTFYINVTSSAELEQPEHENGDSTRFSFRWSFPIRLTFDIEIHGLADISSNIVADSTQVETTVFFQHMLDEQRAIDQHLDPKA